MVRAGRGGAGRGGRLFYRALGRNEVLNPERGAGTCVVVWSLFFLFFFPFHFPCVAWFGFVVCVIWGCLFACFPFSVCNRVCSSS
ncbi:hypothetical protein DFJ73DRAFT_184013 [Zopfochytrium polystomum]|nr:hypothetical protein DFJ73DRAFT_184013 [Zopfochytrium polystomum]